MSILSHHLSNIRSKLRQWLPAQPCLLCGAFSHDGLCCAACRADLPRLPHARCPVCALPTAQGEVCGRCLREPPPFEQTEAAFSYAFPLDALVKALKFHERLIVVDFLAEELAQQIRQRPDAVLALPLHPLRLQARGFNQSQLLAARLAQQFGLPVLNGVAERVRDTPPQSTLPWKERDKNMRHAFAVRQPDAVRGRHLAIVDDVMTTGASTGELAAALKAAGAQRITVWVVARTLPHEKT
ncbi:MAG: ComF family protein [Sideroxydans sp.]